MISPIISGWDCPTFETTGTNCLQVDYRSQVLFVHIGVYLCLAFSSMKQLARRRTDARPHFQRSLHSRLFGGSALSVGTITTTPRRWSEQHLDGPRSPTD